MRGGRGRRGSFSRSVSHRRYIRGRHRYVDDELRKRERKIAVSIVLGILIIGEIAPYLFLLPTVYISGVSLSLDSHVSRPLDTLDLSYNDYTIEPYIAKPRTALDSRIKFRVPEGKNIHIMTFQEKPEMLPWGRIQEEESFTLASQEYQYFVRFFNAGENFSLRWNSEGIIRFIFFTKGVDFSYWRNGERVGPDFQEERSEGLFVHQARNSAEYFFVFEYLSAYNNLPVQTNLTLTVDTLRVDPTTATSIYINDVTIKPDEFKYIFLQNNEFSPAKIIIEKDMKLEASVSLILLTLATFVLAYRITKKVFYPEKSKKKRERRQRRRPNPKYCPECGKPVLPTDRFCENCGKQLKT